MTGITWQEARDKVRERWPSAYSFGYPMPFYIPSTLINSSKTSASIQLSCECNSVEFAWLDAAARIDNPSGRLGIDAMTSSQPISETEICLKCNQPFSTHWKNTTNGDSGCSIVPVGPHVSMTPSQPDAHPSFEAQMQRSIDDGKLVHKRELDAALEEIAVLKGDAQPTELPPIQVIVTDEDRADARAAVVLLFGPEWGDIKRELTNAEAECIALKRDRERLTGTLQTERTLRSQTEAEMTAELATERGLREKNEADAGVAMAELLKRSRNHEADSTRLRAALTIGRHLVESAKPAFGMLGAKLDWVEQQKVWLQEVSAIQPVEGGK